MGSVFNLECGDLRRFSSFFESEIRSRRKNQSGEDHCRFSSFLDGYTLRKKKKKSGEDRRTPD
jgi:hypothetical protein